MSDFNVEDITLAEGPEVEAELARGDIMPNDEKAEEIMNYVLEEAEKIMSGEERKNHLDKLKKWRRQREGRPEQEEKSYPWPGASNVSVPIAMMNGNGIYALLKSSMGQRRPFGTMHANNRDYAQSTEALEKLVDILIESPNHINLRHVNNDILYEVATLGYEFVKVPWVTDRWQFKRTGPGGSMEVVNKIRRNSPAVVPIRSEDFICRPMYYDLQRAPMVGHRVYLMEHELRQRQANGIYQNVEKVLEGGVEELDEARRDQLERMGITPDTTRDMKLYEIYEIYLFEDIDDDGVPEDIILWIDPVTKTYLRTEYNELGVRPFVKLGYLERPGELYAMGTGWMSEHLQDEIDALHNMRIDATHLSSLQMYVTREGSGVADLEEFRPLKNIQVNNPREDFIPIKFPDISGGSLQAEMLAKEYADRVTGASDAMMGFESQTIGSRATASGTMFLAQQGSKLFNAILESVEAGYGELLRLIVFQLMNHKDIVEEEYLPMLSPEDQEALRLLLELEAEEIPTLLQFSVKTTDVDQTEEAKRQMKLTLTQLYTMYGEKVFQMLPMVYSPEVPEPIKQAAAKFFVGSTKMMEDVFESFGEQETDDYLPYIRDLEMLLGAMEQQKDQQLGQLGGMNVRPNSQAVQPGPGGGQVAGGGPGQPGGAPAQGIPGPAAGGAPTGPGGEG